MTELFVKHILRFAFLAALLSISSAHAGDFDPPDFQVTGQLGVGTRLPRARLEVQMSPSDQLAVKIAGPGRETLLAVDRFGRVGIGTLRPEATLDIDAPGNDGMLLRAGGREVEQQGDQIAFTNRELNGPRFGLRTRHTIGPRGVNAMDFVFSTNRGRSWNWRDSGILTVASSNRSACSVQVRPVGFPEFELEVSSGDGAVGGGIIRYRHAGEHSDSSSAKRIENLDKAAATRAYADVRGLRHAAFRYKQTTRKGYVADQAMPLTQGLIYEDAPESIRGPDNTLIVDERVMNLELALQAINQKIDEAEAKIAQAEKRRQP